MTSTAVKKKYCPECFKEYYGPSEVCPYESSVMGDYGFTCRCCPDCRAACKERAEDYTAQAYEEDDLRRQWDVA